jgi:hypothetical protein
MPRNKSLNVNVTCVKKTKKYASPKFISKLAGILPKEGSPQKLGVGRGNDP